MDTKKAILKKRIAAANKDNLADLVIINGKIIDVFNLEIMEGDVAITDGMFVGIGEFEGKQVIDAKGRYISPSFIDAHVHIESSMVTPAEFAKVVLPHGVTTVITDPHEIGNVSGEEGIGFMLDDSGNIPLDVFTMLPSCVPATPFENAGAMLTAKELKPFYTHERVLGLAEVMDYPSLQNADDSIVDKITVTSKYSHNIDGHLAGLDTNAINVYKSAGIRTDHECTTVPEALDRIRRGMYVLIREGSVAKDLKALIGVVNERNARRCLFCTDDKHLDD
jgi:adenine deaminase